MFEHCQVDFNASADMKEKEHFIYLFEIPRAADTPATKGVVCTAMKQPFTVFECARDSSNFLKIH